METGVGGVVGTRPLVAPAVGLGSSKVLHLNSTTELPRSIKKEKRQILEPIVLDPESIGLT